MVRRNPATGDVVDHQDRLVIEDLGQPGDSVRPRYGITELGRGLADLGQQASGGAELPPGHRSDHQVHPVADIEPRESDRGRLPLRQAKAPRGGTGR